MNDFASATPLGYLAGVLIALGMKLMALAPPRFSGPLSAVTYRLGLVANELPFVFLYLLVASTLLAFGQGDIRQPGGWAAVGIAVLAATGPNPLSDRERQVLSARDRGWP